MFAHEIESKLLSSYKVHLANFPKIDVGCRSEIPETIIGQNEN